jgi:hypothetical protein
MHAVEPGYRCDEGCGSDDDVLETLVLCVMGERRGLCAISDLDYFNRKQFELFGRLDED